MSCDEQQAHLLSLLREGSKLTQRRAQEVQGNTALSEVTRADFRQSAEWLTAWLRDHAERLERAVDCEALPQTAKDAYAQILPFHLMSLRASASLTIWELDQLLQKERVAPFEEARGLLRQVLEEGGDAERMRIIMRRAAFAAHQGLRILRSHGIME